jgi:hypothetical protein
VCELLASLRPPRSVGDKASQEHAPEERCHNAATQRCRQRDNERQRSAERPVQGIRASLARWRCSGGGRRQRVAALQAQPLVQRVAKRPDTQAGRRARQASGSGLIKKQARLRIPVWHQERVTLAAGVWVGARRLGRKPGLNRVALVRVACAQG